MLNNTQHFNQLTEAESERLDVLAEEFAEGIQAIMKIKRHGYASTNNGAMETTNRGQLEREIGHVMNAINMLMRCSDIDGARIQNHAAEKRLSIHKWLHHQ